VALACLRLGIFVSKISNPTLPDWRYSSFVKLQTARHPKRADKRFSQSKEILTNVKNKYSSYLFLRKMLE
ncbi:MAG: hypothetical protein P1P64_02180, partial [Treponemataceae bacterium]